jgi:hypothetical protein
MGADVSISTSFTQAPGTQPLAVLKSGPGQGTVTSSPAGINCGADCTENYTAGTAVTLTAAPRPFMASTNSAALAASARPVQLVESCFESLLHEALLRSIDRRHATPERFRDANVRDLAVGRTEDLCALTLLRTDATVGDHCG